MTITKKIALLMLKNHHCGDCGNLAYLCSNVNGNYVYFCNEEKSERPRMSLAETGVPCRFWETHD